MIDAPFIKGLELSRLYYGEVVRPLLAQYFPDLLYSAARLAGGSDVLGFDTPQSRDHDWGPRLTLFLSEEGYEAKRADVDTCLRQKLPDQVYGYPTNFGRHEDGSANMEASEGAPINHLISIQTVRSFFQSYLRYDTGRAPQLTDWLSFPEQRLRTIASGRVFHDGLGELEPIRIRLRYYPRDLWLYLMAVQWRRISQEEAFLGRAGDVGDDLGSRIIAARLVRDVMKLCFLIERQYAPYSKWFGSAFSQLHCSKRLNPLFVTALQAASWREREKHLSEAYSILAGMHNDLAITPPLPTTVSRFHNRPYLVIHADEFATAIRKAIVDPNVLSLPENIGAVDQFIDSTDVLSYPEQFSRVRLFVQTRSHAGL